MTPDIAACLDLDRYPLHAPESAAYAGLVAASREAWRTAGAVNLPGLLRPGMAAAAAAELDGPVRSRGHRHVETHNIYFSDDVEGVPAEAAAYRSRTANHTLTCDRMAGTIIRAVYEWDPLRAFVRDVLELPALYRMADPLARLNVMAYGPGDELGWHFDRAKFAVTLLLRGSESGGAFEYRRDLRTAEDPNYAGVARLLDGADDAVQVGEAAPGTMTLFAGFGAAHRVAPVTGETPRMMAVLGYMEAPDVTFTPEERVRFYGRPYPDEAPAPAPTATTEAR